MPEKVYLIFHPTRLAFLKWYLAAFLIIVTGIFIILNAFDFLKYLIIPKEYSVYTIFIPFIGIVFIIIAGLLRKLDTYIITNFRVIERRGLLNIKEDSVNWEKISNYTLSQSMIDRLFNIGTIRLYSMGGIEEEAEVTIKKVSNIHKIKAFLDKLIERKQGPVV
ncbi:MAG: PH domain-containing protein [Candidatus Aenigmatarchaeota archaeon]